MNTPVITISNRDPDPIREPYYHLPAFKESCRRQGISPIFLPGVYKGLMSKPRLLLEYLHKEGGSFAHAIVCDSWDILLLCGTDEILYNYKGFGVPIIFNSEKNCFPRADLADLFPATFSSYRFLNSGFMVGETAAIIHMLETMRDKWGFPDDRRKEDGSFECKNDQEFYSLYFLHESAGKVALDHTGILCQSLHDSEINEFAFLPDTKRVISLLTKNQPCACHGNGSGKQWLKRIIGWLGL